MKNDLQEHLIDLVYEAAVVPEFWPDVRNQLRAVLAKTGLRRQVELAGLLAGAKLPTGSTLE